VARHAAATVPWVVLATAKDDWGCFVSRFVGMCCCFLRDQL